MSLVREFHIAFDQPYPSVPTPPDDDLLRLRLRLLKEEMKEVEEEMIALRKSQSLPEQLVIMGRLLKELCDLRYVAEGAVVAFGIGDYDEAYAEVHRSNMSKLAPDGAVLKDAGGKVLKGPHYTPASMDRWVAPIIEIPEEDIT